MIFKLGFWLLQTNTSFNQMSALWADPIFDWRLYFQVRSCSSIFISSADIHVAVSDFEKCKIVIMQLIDITAIECVEKSHTKTNN